MSKEVGGSADSVHMELGPCVDNPVPAVKSTEACGNFGMEEHIRKGPITNERTAEFEID